MPGLVSCPIQLLPGMQQRLKPYLVRVCWWPSPLLMQFSGRMLAWSFWVQFFRHSSCRPSEEITVFYQQPCNAPELQPGPGLKEGYLKSKHGGGKREKNLWHPIWKYLWAVCSNESRCMSTWGNQTSPNKAHWCQSHTGFGVWADFCSYWLACLCNPLQAAR